MFSLLITILSIALVALLALSTLYYVSDVFSERSIQAQAGTVRLQAQQIAAAMDMHRATLGTWPADLEALRAGGYLKSIPQPPAKVSAAPSVLDLVMSEAVASSSSWQIPQPNRPHFWLRDGVSEPLCQAINGIALGSTTVASAVDPRRMDQCFGDGAPYTYIYTMDGSQMGDDLNPPGSEEMVATVPVIGHKGTPSFDIDTTAVQWGTLVTITNNGSTPTTMDAAQPTAGATITDLCAGTTLAPGQSCQIYVSAGSGTGYVRTGSGNSSTLIGYTAPAAPSFTISPTSWNVGKLIAGQSASQTFFVTNSATGSILFDVATVTGAGMANYTMVDGCFAQTVARGMGCAITLTAGSAATASLTGTLTVSTSQPGYLVKRTASLAGSVVLAAAAPSQSSFVLNGVVVGDPQPRAATITVSNTGDEPLTFAPVVAVGSGFTYLDGCANRLVLPGTSCALTTTAAPTAAGVFSGSMTVSTVGDIGPARTIPVNGAAALATFTAPNVGFGTTTIGLNTTRNVTVTNTSEGNVRFDPAQLSGEGYTLVSDGCSGTTVAASATCQIQVRSTPVSAGAQPGSVVVTTTQGGPLVTQTSTLSGAGAALAFAATPATVDFGTITVGNSAVRDVTVTNTNSGPVPFNGSVVTGSGFTIVNDFCNGATLVANGTCTVRLRSTPTAAGTHSGTLTTGFTYGGYLVTRTNTLTGQAALATFTVAPSTLAFGNVAIGGNVDLTATVTNTSAGAVQFNPSTVSGTGYAIVSDTCGGATVAANATCAVQVRSTPVATGAQPGTLAVTTGQGGYVVQQTATLSGTGIVPPTITLSPTPLQFGKVLIGSSGELEKKTVRVTNTSALPVLFKKASFPQIPQPFQVDASACAGTLPAGAGCDLIVRPSPTDPVGYAVPLSVDVEQGGLLVTGATHAYAQGSTGFVTGTLGAPGTPPSSGGAGYPVVDFGGPHTGPSGTISLNLFGRGVKDVQITRLAIEYGDTRAFYISSYNRVDDALSPSPCPEGAFPANSNNRLTDAGACTAAATSAGPDAGRNVQIRLGYLPTTAGSHSSWLSIYFSDGQIWYVPLTGSTVATRTVTATTSGSNASNTALPAYHGSTTTSVTRTFYLRSAGVGDMESLFVEATGSSAFTITTYARASNANTNLGSCSALEVGGRKGYRCTPGANNHIRVDVRFAPLTSGNHSGELRFYHTGTTNWFWWATLSGSRP